MKKMVILIAALAMVTGFSTSSFADISGSAHDLSSTTPGNQICVVCHTPHNSDTAVTGAPLWDHTVTTETFTLYSLPSSTGTLGTSLLCLSCHDGATNVDAFGGSGGTGSLGSVAFPETITGSVVGTDLQDDHPVAVTYPSGGNSDFHSDASFTGTLTPKLFSGVVECASCHDPHGVTGVTKFLRLANSNSDLCLACHIK